MIGVDVVYKEHISHMLHSAVILHEKVDFARL